jgi:hypothetical protein
MDWRTEGLVKRREGAQMKRWVRSLLEKSVLFLLLAAVTVSPANASGPASANSPGLQLPAESGSPFTLHGVVEDQSGNPLQAYIAVNDKQNNPLAGLSTNPDGAYSVTLPAQESIMVTATPYGIPENVLTLPNGKQISKYFELTKGILPASADVNVDFALPPAAALWLQAYSSAGVLMNYDAVNKAINPPEFYGYDGVYGLFPEEDIDLAVPTEPNIGMFRWAWPADNAYADWEPCFGAPVDEPFFIMMLWEVPGEGTLALRADNQGAGYSLEESQILKVNLVYEFAETEHRRTLEKKTQLESEGHSFSAGTLAMLGQADTALAQARSQSDPASKATSSYDVLKYSLRAREQMTVEAATADIPARKDDLHIVVHDAAGNALPGMNITYSQDKLDFVMTAGIGAPFNPFPFPGYLTGIDVGISSMYFLIRWNEVSPSQGVYDFSALDAEYQQIRDMGFDITAYLAWLGRDNVPAWAANLPLDEFKQQVKLFVKAVVEHYAGRIKYMNIATEMNLQVHSGTRYISVRYPSSYLDGVLPSDLIELIRAALEGGREVHSDMLLGYYGVSDYNYSSLNPPPSGGWSVTYAFWKSMLEAGVRPDYIGIELYPGTGGIPQDLSNVAETLRAYHDLSGLPVMVVETNGISSRAEDYGETGPAPHVYWHEGFTQAVQSEWETSFYKIALSQPYVLGLQMFTSGGPDDPPQANGEPLGNCMGIPECVSHGTTTITQDWQPKQVFYDMKNLIASWKTNGSSVTDQAGQVHWSGLAGTYTLEVAAPNGLRQNYIQELNAESNPVVLTFDNTRALQDMQSDLTKAQRKVDWSEKLGRTLDYPGLRSKLSQAQADMTAGEYGNSRTLIEQVMDTTAITVDGNPADWQGIQPLQTLPEGGGTVNVPGIDLKALYGIVDEHYLYLLVEVYDPPIVVQPQAMDGSFWYPQFLFDLQTGPEEWHHLRTYLPYRGQINVYHVSDPFYFIGTYYSIGYGQALELRVPLSQIGQPQGIQVCSFVMANENNVEKVSKGFPDCAAALQPYHWIYLPLIRR